MPPLSRTIPGVLACFGLFAGLGGCAPAASQLSGAAVEGAIETVEEPDNLDSVADIAGSEKVQDSVEELSAAVTRGAAQGLVDGPIELEREELESAVEAIGASLARGLVKGLRQETRGMPSAEAIVDDVITGALESATTEQNRERTRLLLATISDSLVRGMTSSLAEGMEEDLMPAVESASSRAQPAVASMLENEQTQKALGSMIYEVSRQTTLGFEEAMEQIRAENRAQEEGVLGRISLVGWAALAGLVVLLLGALVAVIVLIVRNRRHREQLLDDTREREQIMTTLFSALASKDEQLDDSVRLALMRYLGVENKADAGAAGESDPGEPGGGSDSDRRPPSRLIPALE